ncbi:N-acyl-L-homoserine lactone synthetase [Shimia sp. CNT1-13L.2]|uniref:acyl-homoserine-lactone synthase n=1 Tax=Shimia sp. CNT1-13L.2 TaxID=2959663 RepID=UPI0020CF3285|nr:acyl-homoserine-lactone synthase [Shimia sp. CNT1-13L.2]MCP9482912.1 N-acyl-L-homoserine lactone synthetase [Shimia sp. CNT1-13L.2]
MTRRYDKSRLEKKGARVLPGLAPAHGDGESELVAAQAVLKGKAATHDKTSEVTDAGHVTCTVLSVANMSTYGNLYVDFLKARRQIFVEDKGWGLPEVDGMEFDQYDTPFSRWIVLHEYGEILGGVRMIPTTAECGMYSYMLRDAQLGLLDQIPPDILFIDAPVKKNIWEASRIFITGNVPAKRRLQVQTKLMEGMIHTARELGATHVIGIVPAVWSRWLRRMNLKGFPCGPRMQFGKDKSQAVLLNVVEQMH